MRYVFTGQEPPGGSLATVSGRGNGSGSDWTGSIPDPENARQNTIANLSLAAAIYGNNPPWLYEQREKLKGSGIGALVAAEVARLITVEAKIQVLNEPEIDGIIQKYLLPKLREETEKAWALGGEVFKPYFRDAVMLIDDRGQVVSIDEELKIEFKYPTEFRINGVDGSGSIYDICFYTTIKEEKGSHFLTLEERQYYDEVSHTLQISNRVFRSLNAPNVYTWDNLGKEEVPLTEVPLWSKVLPRYLFTSVKGTLVGYFRPAMANNSDFSSPYGLSPLVRAMPALRRVDEIYNVIDWEIEATKTRLYVDELAVTRYEEDHGEGYASGFVRSEPKLPKAILRLVGNESKRYFETFSPSIRDQGYLNILNAYLRQVEDIVGLSRGTLSEAERDVRSRTATEIAFSKQRTFVMVVDNQKALQQAIQQLVEAMFVWLYPSRVASETDTKVSFMFDDSIVANPQDQLGSLLLLHQAGLIHGIKILMTYFNVDAKEAIQIYLEAQTEIHELLQKYDEEAPPGLVTGKETVNKSVSVIGSGAGSESGVATTATRTGARVEARTSTRTESKDADSR